MPSEVINQKMVDDYLQSLPNTSRGQPFGPSVLVYEVSHKMFALVPKDRDPVQISLKCDPELAKILRQKYESVMPGQNLNKEHWNTLVLSGQLDWEEIQHLIQHAYQVTQLEI